MTAILASQQIPENNKASRKHTLIIQFWFNHVCMFREEVFEI
jgi:hypothetical protein